MEQLKFPIGQFVFDEANFDNMKSDYIQRISKFHSDMIELLLEVSPQQLQNPYRKDGWNTIQVINHVADSHMNALQRVKLAITTDQPSINPYPQEKYVALYDTQTLSYSHALDLIKLVHERFVALWENMTAEEYAMTYIHPEYLKIYTMKEVLAMYSWHCNHHYHHVKLALNKI